MKQKYKWAKGARIKADAQQVGEELHRFRATTADAVLDRARQTTSALHAAFEWDDSLAAEQHRLEQARLVLRSLRVVRVTVTGEPAEPRRVFVNLSDNEPKDRYVHTDKLRAEEREMLLAQLKRELRAWAKRNEEFRDHATLAKVFRAIEELDG